MTVDTTVHIHTAKRSPPTTNPQTHRHTYKYGRWDSLNCPSHTLSVYWRHVFLLKLTLLSNCFSNKIQLKRRTVIQWLKFYHWFPIGTSIRLSPRTGKLCFSLPHASPFSFTHTHTLSFKYGPIPRQFFSWIQCDSHRSMKAKETPAHAQTLGCLQTDGICSMFNNSYLWYGDH